MLLTKIAVPPDEKGSTFPGKAGAQRLCHPRLLAHWLASEILPSSTWVSCAATHKDSVVRRCDFKPPQEVEL